MVKLLQILLFSALLIPTYLNASAAASSAKSEKYNVLILNSYHYGLAWSDSEMTGVIETIQQVYPESSLQVEFLDTKRKASYVYRHTLGLFLAEKYRDQEFDLVVVLDNNALDLICSREYSLFTASPVVFLGINNYKPALTATRMNITGLTESLDIEGTLRVALRLFPETREVFAVHDQSSTGLALKAELEEIHTKLTDFPDIRINYSPPESLRETVKRVARLEKEQLILFLTYTVDSAGSHYNSGEITSLFTKNSNVPIFALHGYRLGKGIVGGMLLSGYHHGVEGGKIATRVLGGESADSIGVRESKSVPMFDASVLDRFNISPKTLPANGVVINQPKSWWVENKNIVLTSILIFFLMACTILVLFIAILRQSRAEKSLAESEEKFRNFAEQSFVGFYILRNENLRYVNPKFAEIFGYSVKECLDNLSIRDLIYQDDYQRVKANVAQRLTGGKVEQKYRARGVHKSGEVIHLQIYGSTLIVNKEVAAIGVILDTTAEVRAKQQLEQAQRLEAIGNLAGGIAHDFNNILSPISGYAELLVEELPPESRSREDAVQIVQAGRRAKSLVDQILAFSRRKDTEKTVVKLQSVVKEVLKLSRATIPTSIKIIQSLQNECRPVLADATRLHQLTMNLITNSYHAVEGTCGYIDVEVKEVQLTSGKEEIDLPAGTYAFLQVKDNGVGIERDALDTIFEPYFTTKEQGKGTGLGLSVVYGIVTELHGRIKVESDLGKGTVFQVFIPVLSEGEYVEPDSESISVQRGCEHILIVDDEQSVADLTSAILDRLGYRTTVMYSSVKAYEFFKENSDQYDLVITDLNMPEMKGDDLVRKILQIQMDLPIILCTGFSEELDAEKATLLGAKGFLMKPIEKSELAQMVRGLLD